jgi:ATP-binding protein involved in chromosome partitioning
MVQNMSFFCCPNCNSVSNIFGTAGVEKKAKELNVDLLANVPLHEEICTTSDQGKPITISSPESLHAKIYLETAKKIWDKISN